jgi:hypothetical protein
MKERWADMTMSLDRQKYLKAEDQTFHPRLSKQKNEINRNGNAFNIVPMLCNDLEYHKFE